MNFCENIYFAAWEMMWSAWWSFRYDKDSDDEWASDEDTSENDMDIDNNSDSDRDASDSDSNSEDPDPFPAWKHKWLSTYFSNIRVIRFCDLPQSDQSIEKVRGRCESPVA